MLLRTVDPKKIPDPIGSGSAKFVVVVVETTYSPFLSLSGSISWRKAEGRGGCSGVGSERKKTEKGREGPGLALLAGAYTV